MFKDKDWYVQIGAAPTELDDLMAASGNSLPDDYLSFLSMSNGGEGPL